MVQHAVIDHTGLPGISSFSGARCYENGAQTVTAATETTLTFGSEDFDTDSYHAGGSPTRLTFPTTAKYLVQAHIGIPGTAGVCYARFRLNGSTIVTGSEDDNSGTDISLHCSAIIAGVASEYIEVRAFRTTGTTFGAATGSFSNTFEIVRLG